MKGISVRIRKITLHTDNGYYGVRWYYPAAKLPPRFTDHANDTLDVYADDIVNGIVVSEPFVVEDNACVVVKLQTDGQFDSYETFWIGHLG